MCELPTLKFYTFQPCSYLQNANNVTISKLHEVIKGLNKFEFGSFDEFVRIKDVDTTDLDHIDLKELYQRVMNVVACFLFRFFFLPSIPW